MFYLLRRDPHTWAIVEADDVMQALGTAERRGLPVWDGHWTVSALPGVCTLTTEVTEESAYAHG